MCLSDKTLTAILLQEKEFESFGWVIVTSESCPAHDKYPLLLTNFLPWGAYFLLLESSQILQDTFPVHFDLS